jgi:hypothetical protein
MTIKISGSSLSFSEIIDEFGQPPGKNLGAYRVNTTISGLSGLALDNQINSSGIVTALMPKPGFPIKFSDFYGKKLNIVIDCTPSIGSTTRKVNARSNYTNNTGVIVVGGFLQRPYSPAGKRVWIHTNGPVGSDKPSQLANDINYCSLIVGSPWDQTTDLIVDIGSSGIVMGAGGRGGNGGDGNAGRGSDGGNGNSAIGINTSNPIIIVNRGTILAGYGGGGGGGGGWRGINALMYAGGGGGGGGIPDGQGGTGNLTSVAPSNVAPSSIVSPGKDGGTATITTQGIGGAGAEVNAPSLGDGSMRYLYGGRGGDGNSAGGSANSGGQTAAQYSYASGGNPGARGYAIVIFNTGSNVTLYNSGTINGTTVYNTTPT